MEIGAGMIAIMKKYNKNLKISDNPYLGPEFSPSKIYEIIKTYKSEFMKKINFKKFNSKESI